VDEQGRDLVRIVEHQTVSPSNDSAGQRAMGQAVTRHPQRYARGEDPKEQEVEDGRVVTQVE